MIENSPRQSTGDSVVLEQELRTLLGGDRTADIAGRYFGFDGRGPRTLQAVGDEIDLKRERVRQIVKQAFARICTRAPAQTPILDRALDFVRRNIPDTGSVIAAKLESSGLTAGPFQIPGLLEAVSLLGRKPEFTITGSDPNAAVHNLNPPTLHALLSTAESLISCWGMTEIHQVADRIGSVDLKLDRERAVTVVLRSRSDFRWLDESSGWFWLTNVPTNPMLRCIRKVLAVANPIYLSDLRKAVARSHRMQKFFPPCSVMQEFCRQIPECTIRNDSLWADRFLTEKYLSRVERQYVRILRQNDGVITRSQLRVAILKDGMNGPTIDHHLVYSPLLVRRARGRYALVGSVVEDLRRTEQPFSSISGSTAKGRKAAKARSIRNPPPHLTLMGRILLDCEPYRIGTESP